MVDHLGILDGSGKAWGVRFPGIPGCAGAGGSPEDAIADATFALRDVMTCKRHKEFALPKAKPISELLAFGGLAPGETAT